MQSNKFLLDYLTSSPVVAFGLRRLYSKYTGPLINVRRSSDNATRDIYFDLAGNLDTTDLLTFTGSGSCYVTTFYDQSLNRLNVTQSAAVNQPQIVNLGSLITSNGIVSALYATSYLQSSLAFTAFNNTSHSINAVLTTNSTPSNLGYLSSTDGQFFMGMNSNGTFLKLTEMNAGTSAYSFTLNTLTIVTVNRETSGSTYYINGSAKTASSNPTLTLAVTTALLNIGYGGGSSYWNGNISEIILMKNDLTTHSDRVAIEYNQGIYYGISTTH